VIDYHVSCALCPAASNRFAVAPACDSALLTAAARVDEADKAARGEGGASEPYAALGLDATATQSEIRRAYRRLSLRLHPDKNPGVPEAQRAFEDLVVAYEILGDPDTRTAFDDYGMHAAAAAAAAATVPHL
jgi:DnaJ-class molecular chaperone